MTSAIRSRVPLPVLVLVGAAVTVLVLLLARFVIGFIIGLIQLALILGAFAGIGLIGYYLWHRGDVRGRG